MPLRMNLCLAASSEGVGASKIDRPLGAARSAQREDTGTVYFACWEGDRSPPIPLPCIKRSAAAGRSDLSLIFGQRTMLVFATTAYPLATRKGPSSRGRLAGADPDYRRLGVRRLSETANPLPEVIWSVRACRERRD